MCGAALNHGCVFAACVTLLGDGVSNRSLKVGANLFGIKALGIKSDQQHLVHFNRRLVFHALGHTVKKLDSSGRYADVVESTNRHFFSLTAVKKRVAGTPAPNLLVPRAARVQRLFNRRSPGTQ